MHGLQWDYSFPRSPHGESIGMLRMKKGTKSMERIPYSENNSHSGSYEILAFFGTLRFITVFTRARNSEALCNIS